jgi:hypothetical protein
VIQLPFPCFQTRPNFLLSILLFKFLSLWTEFNFKDQDSKVQKTTTETEFPYILIYKKFTSYQKTASFGIYVGIYSRINPPIDSVMSLILTRYCCFSLFEYFHSLNGPTLWLFPESWRRHLYVLRFPCVYFFPASLAASIGISLFF